MKEGILPQQWKLQEVHPLFKKGDRSSPGNYRPVSLTSLYDVVFEGFIRDALFKHFSDNDLLSKHQFGFLSWEIMLPATPCYTAKMVRILR